MKGTIWYVSKYVGTPTDAAPGARGYEIMRELAAVGHQCIVVTSDSNHLVDVPEFNGSHLLREQDGLQVCWLRTLKARRAKSLARMLSWLHFEWQLLRLPTRRLHRPDVIVVSSLSLLTLVTGVVLRRRHQARLVVEIRDIWPLTLVEEGGFDSRNPIIRVLGWIERLGYRHADAVVGTMPNLGEHVEHILGHPKPTYCIPMGFAPRMTAESPPSINPALGVLVPPASFVVGYAGTVGITNALEPYFLAAEALSTQPDVHFLVLGDGGLLGKFQQRYGHLPNLAFLPKVAKHDVAAVLSRCDLLYLSTFNSKVWRYGQSLNKLVDYMLAGKPVLASYSGFPSMINEAQSGTFVPADDVRAVVSEVRRYAAMSAQEREQIGQRGRDWILKNRNFRTLAEAYEPILFPGLHR